MLMQIFSNFIVYVSLVVWFILFCFRCGLNLIWICCNVMKAHSFEPPKAEPKLVAVTMQLSNFACLFSVWKLKIRDFKSADFEDMRNYLRHIDWLGSFNNTHTVNEKYETFLAILNHAVDISSQAASDWNAFHALSKRWTQKPNKYNASIERKKKLSEGGVRLLYSLLKYRLRDKLKIGTLLSETLPRAIKEELLTNTFEKVFSTSHELMFMIQPPWFENKTIANTLEKWSSAASTNCKNIPFT
ncbi:hypothetical protein OSTOST_24209, partial [Ostertagia ostertagi]